MTRTIVVEMSIDNEENKTFEGGYGYIVALGMTGMFIVSVGPLSAFGIIHDNFLSKFGDKAESNQIINSIFNTFVCLMGLVSNQLCQKYSFRFVGLLGAFIFFLGTFTTIFVKSVVHLSLTFGVLQGTGFGLMACASFSTFNDHFSARKNVVMSVSQSFIAVAVIAIPYFCYYLMDKYDYRGTLIVICAFSLHNFAAMLIMLPAKKQKDQVVKKFAANDFPLNKEISDYTYQKYEIVSTECNIKSKMDLINKEENKYIQTKSSLPSVQPLLAKNINTNETSSIWQFFQSFFELSLMRDPKYVNIAIGLALCVISDLMFLPLIPTFLKENNYSDNDIVSLMTFYLVSDCVTRILYAIVNNFIILKNRYVFLCGAIFTALLRIVFTATTVGSWSMPICMILLGSLRCFITVLFPLVLMEYSRTQFTAAFGLAQFISTIVSLSVWPFIKIIALLTDEIKIWAVHLLTIFLLLCAVSWTLEILFIYLLEKKIVKM